MPNNLGNLGKIIGATGFEWLYKLQKKIAQSGRTADMSKGFTRSIEVVQKNALNVSKSLNASFVYSDTSRNNNLNRLMFINRTAAFK